MGNDGGEVTVEDRFQRNFKEISENLLPKYAKYGIIILYARTSLAKDIVFIIYGGTYK